MFMFSVNTYWATHAAFHVVYLQLHLKATKNHGKGNLTMLNSEQIIHQYYKFNKAPFVL